MARIFPDASGGQRSTIEGAWERHEIGKGFVFLGYFLKSHSADPPQRSLTYWDRAYRLGFSFFFNGRAFAYMFGKHELSKE
jgi:hypothetical protein